MEDVAQYRLKILLDIICYHRSLANKSLPALYLWFFFSLLFPEKILINKLSITHITRTVCSVQSNTARRGGYSKPSIITRTLTQNPFAVRKKPLPARRTPTLKLSYYLNPSWTCALRTSVCTSVPGWVGGWPREGYYPWGQAKDAASQVSGRITCLYCCIDLINHEWFDEHTEAISDPSRPLSLQNGAKEKGERKILFGRKLCRSQRAPLDTCRQHVKNFDWCVCGLSPLPHFTWGVHPNQIP